MQLALLFFATYLAARVLVRVDAHVALLNRTVAATRDSPARLLLGIMLMTFALSTVVPNLVCVVAVLPIVTLTVDGLALEGPHRDRLLTVLALGVIYAANMGGMASLTGSPHNGLIIAALTAADVPEVERLTFLRWLAFGMPVALGFLVVSWLLLVALTRPALSVDVRKLVVRPARSRRDLRRGLLACAAIGVGIIVCAQVANVWVSVACCVALVIVVFTARLPKDGGPILRATDVWKGLPLRGVAFAVAALAFGAVLVKVGALDQLIALLSALLPDPSHPVAFLAVVVAITVFLTELLSNTATAVAMWALVAGVMSDAGEPAFLPMLGVGLAATCAFMSPLATPATGMVFGGLRGVSLRIMILVGLVANLIAIGWLVVALGAWAPLALGL